MLKRTDFLNTISESDNWEKFESIISNHYFKYDYLYKLCRELWEDLEIEHDIQNIEAENEDYILTLSIEFSNETILRKAYEICDDYLFNITDKGIQGSLEIEFNTLHIILKTDYMEESYYTDENYYL